MAAGGRKGRKAYSIRVKYGEADLRFIVEGLAKQAVHKITGRMIRVK